LTSTRGGKNNEKILKSIVKPFMKNVTMQNKHQVMGLGEENFEWEKVKRTEAENNRRKLQTVAVEF